jgi:dephospho-CoA kinase
MVDEFIEYNGIEAFDDKDVKSLNDTQLVEIVERYGTKSPIAIAAIRELIFRNKRLRREIREIIHDTESE